MEAISVCHRLNVCFSVVKQLFLGGEAALFCGEVTAFLWQIDYFSLKRALFPFVEVIISFVEVIAPFQIVGFFASAG